MRKTTCLLSSFVLVAWTGFAGDVEFPSLDTFYDQCAWLATHNSYANPDEGFKAADANQPNSITEQLNYGVRLLNPDVWLVRQKQRGKAALGNCKWYSEDYRGSDTTFRSKMFDGLPLEAVVAHGDKHTSPNLRQYCTPWKSFTTVLTEIRQWVEAHTNDVITLNLENKIDVSHQSYVSNAFIDSGLSNYVFYLNAPNPDVPAPDGRKRGWVVGYFGYPTLKQLVDARRTVVLFPRGGESLFYEVASVFGAKSMNPEHWTEKRADSYPLDYFRCWTFDFVHVPFLPTGTDYAKRNSIKTLRDKWSDMEARWHRLPTHVWVDQYNKGTTLAADTPPGPALFVNELNEKWKSLTAPTPMAEISGTPSADGWYNTDVDLQLSGTGGPVIAINSREMTSASFGILPTDNTSYHFTDDGAHKVSFTVFGTLGKRSPVTIVDVPIDKTPPTLVGTLDRPPDTNGWYTAPVTAHFECSDALSGIASCPGDQVVSGDGTNLPVTGTAVDRANNQTTTTVTNINIDTLPPVICVTGKPDFLWPPNGKPVAVVICGMITDAGSGVDRGTTSYCLKDEYDRIERSGRIVLGRGGAFRITILLDAKRYGNDHDGRDYKVLLSATDRAGHGARTTIDIIVPHDHRSN